MACSISVKGLASTLAWKVMDAGTVRAPKLMSTATTSAAPPQAPDVLLEHRDKRRKTDTGKSQAI